MLERRRLEEHELFSLGRQLDRQRERHLCGHEARDRCGVLQQAERLVRDQTDGVRDLQLTTQVTGGRRSVALDNSCCWFRVLALIVTVGSLGVDAHRHLGIEKESRSLLDLCEGRALVHLFVVDVEAEVAVENVQSVRHLLSNRGRRQLRSHFKHRFRVTEAEEPQIEGGSRNGLHLQVAPGAALLQRSRQSPVIRQIALAGREEGDGWRCPDLLLPGNAKLRYR